MGAIFEIITNYYNFMTRRLEYGPRRIRDRSSELRIVQGRPWQRQGGESEPVIHQWKDTSDQIGHMFSFAEKTNYTNPTWP